MLLTFIENKTVCNIQLTFQIQKFVFFGLCKLKIEDNIKFVKQLIEIQGEINKSQILWEMILKMHLALINMEFEQFKKKNVIKYKTTAKYFLHVGFILLHLIKVTMNFHLKHSFSFLSFLAQLAHTSSTFGKFQYVFNITKICEVDVAVGVFIIISGNLKDHSIRAEITNDESGGKYVLRCFP